MKKNKKLLIIGHARIEGDTEITAHRGTNEILKSYRNHFEEILYLGAADSDIEIQKTKVGGIKVCAIEFNRSLINNIKYGLNFFKHSKKVSKLINEYEPDIIQLRIPSLFTFIRFLNVRKLGIPITTYIAGDWIKSYTANKNYFGVNFIAKAFDIYQNYIIKHSIPVAAGPILSNHYSHFVDCHAYMSTTHNTVYERDEIKFSYKLLIVGALVTLKRVEDAIYALKNLTNKNPIYHLTIIGEGENYNSLIELVNELNLKDFVTFTGYIEDSSLIHNLYEQSDVLIHPSISEGTPKVLAEAMSFGVIPIAVDGVGSINYIINDKKNGFLVEPKQPVAISQRIFELEKNPELYCSMSKAALEYARNHTLDKEVAKQWNFVFQKVSKKNNQH